MQPNDEHQNGPETIYPLGDEAAPAGEGVNVEDLMARVRKAVEEKKRMGIYRDDEWCVELPHGTVPQAGTDSLTLLRSSAHVDLDGEPIQSHRALTGTVVMAVKRFTRYWVRKYTDPLFLRQSAFNAESVNTLASLRREVDELRSEVNRLKNQLPTEQPLPRDAQK